MKGRLIDVSGGTPRQSAYERLLTFGNHDALPTTRRLGVRILSPVLYTCIQYVFLFASRIYSNFPYMTTTPRNKFSVPDALYYCDHTHMSSLSPYLTLHPKTKKAITPFLTWSFAPSLLAKFRMCNTSSNAQRFNIDMTGMHLHHSRSGTIPNSQLRQAILSSCEK